MKKAMLLFVSFLLSAGANAATFDFATIADTDGEGGFASYMRTEQGLTVTATAPGAFAYLDESGSQGPAGMGVCQELDAGDGSDCKDSSDDSISSGEELVLSFDQEITLKTVDFQDGKHGNSFTGDVWLSVDGAAAVSYALADFINFDLKGTIFSFLNLNVGTGTGDSFYIRSLNAEVPVPAALFLFAPALLGFFGLRRKASLAA